MSFLSSNVAPFVAASAPPDPVQATDWARRQLKGRLSTFVGVTASPAPTLATLTSAAFDVLTSATAFLASTKPTQTAEELDWQIDAYHRDFTQDAIGDHTAENLAAILRPLIGEAARALRLRRLMNAQNALICVVRQTLTAFVARDPDLHGVPVIALYKDLRLAVATADPRRAVVILWDLHDLIGSAIAQADAPVALSTPQPMNVPADLVIDIQTGIAMPATDIIDIQTGIAMPATDIKATIARLEARNTAFDRMSAGDELQAAWIAQRLDELRSQRRVVETTNAPFAASATRCRLGRNSTVAVLDAGLSQTSVAHEAGLPQPKSLTC